MTQEQDLNEQVAVEVFGWKWMSWVDAPTRGTPGYPAECRIRKFVSPKTLTNPRWISFWEGRELRDACGDEPLHYRYCSSLGPEWPPDYQGVADILVLEEVRDNWSRDKIEEFTAALAKIWRERGKPTQTAWMAWGLYEHGDYSRAALSILEDLQ